jgi:hypothetical protein
MTGTGQPAAGGGASWPRNFDGDALDGNAIGGMLMEVFGAEMTAATGTCATCGNRAQLAETIVYIRAPGTVVRCRNCRAVLMVIAGIRAMNCVDLGGLAALDVP